MKLKNNKKALVALFSALGITAISIAASLGVLLQKNTNNTQKNKNIHLREKYKKSLEANLTVDSNEDKIKNFKNKILEQYPYLETEKEYIELNSNIKLTLENYQNILNANFNSTNLEVNKPLESSIMSRLNWFESIITQSNINFNNFDSNITLNSSNILSNIDQVKENEFNLFKKDLETSLNKFENEKIQKIKNKILELYKFQNIPDQYLELNKKILLFIKNLNNFLNIKSTEALSGVEVVFDQNELFQELLEKLNKILEPNYFNYSELSDETNEKITKLASLLSIRNKIISDNNDKMKKYLNNLSAYQFNQQITKDIYLNEKTLAYNNLEFKSSLIEKLYQLDKNTSIIDSILNNYSIQDKNTWLNNYQTTKEELKRTINLETILNFKNNLKNEIKSFSYQSNEENFEVNKTELLDKIENDQKLETDIKEKLKEEVKNSLTNLELSYIKNIFNNEQNDLDKSKAELNILINSILINNNLKEDLNILTSQLDNSDKFIDFFNKFKELKLFIDKLKLKIDEYYSKIIDKSLNGNSEYNFYILLNKNRKIFNNNLIQYFDLSNIQNNINVIKSFYEELEQLSSLPNENKTASQYLKENSEEKFNIENYLGETKYNLEEIKNAASFNFDNAKIFFDHSDTEQFNYTIKNIELEGENLDTLTLTVEVKIKGVSNFAYTFKKSKKYNHGGMEELNNLSYDNLDQLFNINYELLNSYTTEEIEQLNEKQKQELLEPKFANLGKYFKYDVSNIFITSKLNSFINIKFNNQTIKSILLSSINNFNPRTIEKESYWDNINKEKILNIINSNDKRKFFINISLKDPKNRWNHSDFLASEAIEKMNEFYNMPSFGKYEIYIDKITNVDNYNHRADLQLWYKENGIPAPKPVQGLKNSFTVDNFMFLNYEDIKPKAEFFAENDFISEEFNSNQIDSNIKNLMDQINESVLGWNLGSGTIERKGGNTIKIDYRTLNPINFIEQKAFNKLNYFIGIKNKSEERATAGENKDNVDFIGIEDKNKIYNSGVTNFSSDLQPLLRDYFYYFYDIKLVGIRGLSFKIGWIKKDNNLTRYSNNKTYNLINLVNDYEQALYPEIMLNNIKLDDIQVNKQILSEHDADYFISNKDELSKAIELKGQDQNKRLTYRNFKLNVDKFKINDVQKYNSNELYIKLQVDGFDPAHNTAKTFIGNSWYKITGFKQREQTENSNINFYSDFAQQKKNLITIFNSENKIIRQRVIEQYWKDTYWKYNKNEENVYWYLDKKYLEKTILKDTTTKSTIKFIIHADVLLNDGSKAQRLTRTNSDNTYSIDFNQLKNESVIIFDKSTSFGSGNNRKTVEYRVIFKWDENKGIKVIIDSKDKNNKIFIGDPSLIKYSNGVNFDPNKAIGVLPTASEITINYTSTLQEENFDINSNKFDYNDVFYTDNNQPILFSNDTSFFENNKVYYPNQNVPYKFHEGYLMDADILNWNKQEHWDLARDTWMRSVQFVADDRPENWEHKNDLWGSTSIIGKVNNDKNDHKYYLISNRHVIGDNIKDFNNLANNEYYYNLNLAPKHRNNIINQYWGFNQSGSNDKIKAKTDIIWTGLDQKNENDPSKSGTVDLTIFIADFNEQYLDAKRNGKMNIVYKLDYINNYIEPVKFNVDFEKGHITVPSNRNIALIGYPLSKISGIISRRPSGSYTGRDDDQISIKSQSNYAPVYLGAGGSGTSMYLDNNTYFATWWGGNKGFDSYAYRYWTKQHNYIGSNLENQNPFDINNTNSFASQIIRANLKNPNEYSSPWFYNYNFAEEDKDE
ncbi:MGA_1079 family surface serine endopeptidase [Mycoplasma sp. CSL7503-lung]|uniref:MGA_1079 family surface serine endopeptidase n=1 Tax=Mycoplasma sp. CSL7503-lung TaxID=536372 RepID=UPI0021CFF17A|nr:hypothetical protein [Mycoplasma sp. CSL7503-lung]MCU4706906.1 hypothetical protein [Mycoplasma sp. CSL7503-lung]